MSTITAYPTRHPLTAEVREKMASLLNAHLATLSDLHAQTKQAHWNVKGMQFIGLHELFDKLASVAGEPIDTVAERVTALGGTALGTVRESAKNSLLPEYPLDAGDGKAHLEALVSRWALYAKLALEAIDTAAQAGDAGTADLFTDISRDVDKALWFLESHLN